MGIHGNQQDFLAPKHLTLRRMHQKDRISACVPSLISNQLDAKDIMLLYIDKLLFSQ